LEVFESCSVSLSEDIRENFDISFEMTITVSVFPGVCRKGKHPISFAEEVKKSSINIYFI